jgi:hypothetical protein
MRTAEGLWIRDPLARAGPDRSVGGFYRTAENAGMTLGGIPLVDAEDAVVAAVRMAYRVAEAQIDRSARLAQRLRTAGEAAVGDNPARQSVDATEKLVFNAAMSGLGWLENLAAEGDTPIKRLFAVQYRMLGAMLGLIDSSAPPGREPTGAPSPAPPPAQAADGQPAPNRVSRSTGSIRIVHLFDRGRAVRVVAWQLSASGEMRASPMFYAVERPDSTGLASEFTLNEEGQATLRLGVDAKVPPGRWRAAVCDGSRMQVGWIEIEV